MSASYPTSVKAFSARSAGQVIASAHVNDLQDEVNAIETALVNGPIKPAGGSNAAPPYAFNNNATTGLYSSGANALELATGGVKALGIDSTQFIDSPTQPRCRVFNNATQSIADTTVTAIAWNSESFDVGAMHDTVTNNTRVTVPVGGDGLYLVTGQYGFAANATGYRQMTIRKNGATTVASSLLPAVSATNGVGQNVSTLLTLVAGDYVEVIVVQTSGGPLAGGSTTDDVAWLAAVKLW